MVRRLKPRKKTRTKRGRRTRRQRGGAKEKTVDMVIARYKEPLSWLDSQKNRGFHEIHIYNKSDEPVVCPEFDKGVNTKCHVHKIPNTGVCDHTYLYHIVHHYSKLADVTVFTPGSADMDFKNALLNSTVDKAFETKNTVMNIYRFDIPTGEAMYNFTMETYPTGYKDNRDGTNERVPQKLADVRPFGAWYAANFPGDQPKEATFIGVMAMSREHIHRRPKSFYEGLLKQVSTDKFHEVSHFLERSYNAMLHPLPEECYYTSPILEMKIGLDQGAYRVMRR